MCPKLVSVGRMFKPLESILSSGVFQECTLIVVHPVAKTNTEGAKSYRQNTAMLVYELCPKLNGIFQLDHDRDAKSGPFIVIFGIYYPPGVY